jgi:hypothetical protein
LGRLDYPLKDSPPQCTFGLETTKGRAQIMALLEQIYNFFGMPGMPPLVSLIGLVIIATSPLVVVKLRRGSDWYE